MDYSIHNHTPYCDHATGAPEEYVRCALAHGIRTLGFSEHAPFAFPDGYETSYRLPMARARGYVNDLTALRERYHDQIDIHIGFEMEYYPTYFDEMLKIARDVGGEYLILGQHFCGDERPGGTFSAGVTDNVENLRTFVSSTVAAIQSGLFTCVAHPDIIGFSSDEAIYRHEMRKICVAARECDVPLEINFGGIRRGNHFPKELFWEMAGEERSPVTLGFDAHDLSSAYDVASMPRAKELVEKYHLNYIGLPRVISIR